MTVELYAIASENGRMHYLYQHQYEEFLKNPIEGWSMVYVPQGWYQQATADTVPDIQPKQGLDSRYKPLSDLEWRYYREAVQAVLQEAADNAYKRPKITTLLEEFSELVLAARGKHDDPLELEIKQVASVAINLLWQLEMGNDINNIVTNKEPEK